MAIIYTEVFVAKFLLAISKIICVKLMSLFHLSHLKSIKKIFFLRLRQN